MTSKKHNHFFQVALFFFVFFDNSECSEKSRDTELHALAHFPWCKRNVTENITQ